MQTKSIKQSIGLLIAGILIAALACFVGCSGPSSTGGESESSQSSIRTVTDLRGRSVEIPQKVDRVIGIGCALRPMCYLQSADKVVGVEKAEQEDAVSCAYRHVNQDLFVTLPVIGEGGSKGVSPNAEAIVAAAPQLIIADSLEADEADALQQKTGIPVVCIDQPETIFDQRYYDNLIFLGEVLDKQERARELVDYIKGIEVDLSTRSQASASFGKASAYAAGISFRGGHGFDGTEAHFPPFVSCGIVNIADGQGATGPYTIDLEAVASAQPDYLFIESSNLSLVGDDYRANPAYFNALSAVQEGKSYTLISYRYYSTNVELALANCYQVGSVVYADSFSDVNPQDKLDEICEAFLGEPLSSDLAEKGYEFKQVDITSL